MTWKESFKKYAKEQAPNEACGLLAIIEGKKTFWPCKNLAEGRFEFFILDPDDWAKCEDTGEVIGVIHSHPVGAATPSDTDRAACEHLGFPYYIYSIKYDHWESFEPTGWKAPSLIGRKWVWGKQDCWSLITDYFLEKKQIKLKFWPRPKSLKAFANDPYFEKVLIGSGFKEVNKNNIQENDVLLMVGSEKKLNHVALYIGDMTILNHSIRSLSCREPYNLRYQQAVRGVYRYEA